MASVPMQATGIFRAGSDNMAVVARLFRAYQVELGIGLDFQGFSEELAALPGPYAEPGGCILLARDRGEAVGVVALKPLDLPEIGEVKRLFVLPEYRGRGVAQGLCLRVEGEARLRGYQRLKLDTLARLTAANRLYDALGYARTEPYNHNPEPDPLYFEKEL